MSLATGFGNISTDHSFWATTLFTATVIAALRTTQNWDSYSLRFNDPDWSEVAVFWSTKVTPHATQ